MFLGCESLIGGGGGSYESLVVGFGYVNLMGSFSCESLIVVFD